MAEISIQEKISSYVASHAELRGKSEAVILSAMQKEGLVTQAEIDSAKLTSAFGFGFNKTEDVGLSVQKTVPQVKTVPVDQPVEITHLTYEQAQDYAIGNIQENLQKAIETYHSIDNGTITEGYDELKNFFDTELSSKNVSDVLNKEALSVAFLENAKNGSLTKREYYEKNKDHLQSLLMKRFTQQDRTGVDALDKYKGDLSKEEFAKLLESYIKEKIDTISTIEGIKDFQHEVLMLDEEQNVQFLGKIAEEAKKQDITWTPDGPLMPRFKANFEKHPFDSEEPMTFEETYLLERGVEFSQNSMDILMQSEGELQFATSVYNKVNTLKTAIRDVQNEYKKQAKEFVDQKTGAYYYEEPDPNPRKDKITQIISEYYMLNPEQAKTDLDEIIQKSQLDLKVELNEDNNLSINFGERDNSSSQRNKNLNLLLSGLGKLQETRLKEVLGGKDYNTYLMTNKSNYEHALGKQNAEELANAMKMDNLTVIDSVTGTAAMGGMATMVIGGVLTVIPFTAPVGAVLTGVGGKVALGGMAARNALGLTEAYTRDNVDSEEVKQRYKDLAMDIGGLVIGGYAGKLGLQYGMKITQNGGSLLQAKLVEHGTDFVISVAGDMAMVGAMSYEQSMGETFKQNAIGIIVSTITGISASKTMSRTATKGVDTNLPKADLVQDAEVKPESEIQSKKEYTSPVTEERSISTEADLMSDGTKVEEVRVEAPKHESLSKSVSEIREELINLGLFEHNIDNLTEMYGAEGRISDKIVDFAERFLSEEKIKFGKEYESDVKRDGYIDPQRYITAEKNRTLKQILKTVTDKSGNVNIEELNKIVDFLTKDGNQIFVDDLFVYLDYGKNSKGEVDLNTVQKIKSLIQPKTNEPLSWSEYQELISLHVKCSKSDDAVDVVVNDLYDYDTYNKLLNCVEKPWELIGINIILEETKDNPAEHAKFLEDPVAYLRYVEIKNPNIYSRQFYDKVPFTDYSIEELRDITKVYLHRGINDEFISRDVVITPENSGLAVQMLDNGYYSSEIKELLENVDSDFMKILPRFIEGYTEVNRVGKIKFRPKNDINHLLNIKELYVSDPEIVTELSEIRTVDSNGNSQAISAGDMRIAVKACRKDKALYLSYMKMKNDDGSNIFDSDTSASLVINYGRDSKCIELVKIMCADKDFPKHKIVRILDSVNEVNQELAKTLCTDKNFPKDEIEGILSVTDEANLDLAKIICADKDFPKGEIHYILENVNETNIDLAKELCADPKLPKHWITYMLSGNENDTLSAIEAYKILSKNSDFPNAAYRAIVTTMENYKLELFKELYSDKYFSIEETAKYLSSVNGKNYDIAQKLINDIKNGEIALEHACLILSFGEKFSYTAIKQARKIFGQSFLNGLNESDLQIVYKFSRLKGIQNINEIPVAAKKKLIRDLVASNTDMFNMTPELAEKLPILPKTQEEYCELLPALVRSMGVETTPLTPQQKIDLFHSNVGNLSTSLARISDTDFANLRITQAMPKEEFIRTVLDKVKDLTPQERQKVYDYYGFELHHNKANETGFSITGYPVNLNNGHKLAQITDPATKAVVESLRADVIRFSKENKIKCNNPQVELFLNEIVDVLPEIRTMIGRAQHGNNGTKGSHDFDVMQHSLKVMQKLTQDPKFEALNETDKKLMLLASLMHDITKAEGVTDKTHANESSFDTFFIAKKFQLSKEEELKLYRLIKHHEWLEYVNTAKTEKEQIKRLQSVAYDLQQDNLIDLTLMFTHADLRAVKVDDTFHDTTIGNGRTDFQGNPVSFGAKTDIFGAKLKEFVAELQKTQPLLPVTKIPAADVINRAITRVNADGSTNIKGVYKDSDGLIVIKFNEVEDWEALGFPKGSISRGIESECADGTANTGNIKFFVHGLDYANQLSRFDAFSLVDSDALLSVSYTERPEGKFRFFRPQGVVLDVATENIHGGGNTDAGSGCKKDVQNFKDNYVFGGRRESDRTYVSDLIKEATGMTDEEYVRFIQENGNKDFTEIEPLELREKIIKIFATINSNTRKGDRAYNEMYISNPNVMAVFAYDMNYESNVGNPLDFLGRTELGKGDRGYNGAKAAPAAERTAFLRQYALENNLPFIVFGD